MARQEVTHAQHINLLQSWLLLFKIASVGSGFTRGCESGVPKIVDIFDSSPEVRYLWRGGYMAGLDIVGSLAVPDLLALGAIHAVNSILGLRYFAKPPN